MSHKHRYIFPCNTYHFLIAISIPFFSLLLNFSRIKMGVFFRVHSCVFMAVPGKEALSKWLRRQGGERRNRKKERSPEQPEVLNTRTPSVDPFLAGSPTALAHHNPVCHARPARVLLVDTFGHRTSCTCAIRPARLRLGRPGRKAVCPEG